MRIKRTKKNSGNKTVLILVLSILAVGILGVSAYALYFAPHKTNEPTSQGVNLERSDAEKAASDALKKNPEQKLENAQSDTPSTPEKSASTGKFAVNVLLSNAGIYNGTVSAGGMVTDYQEADGICTYVFTNGNLTITKTSTTLLNPTSMTCKTVNFPSNELAASGIWKVKITYSSSNAEGTSNEKDITK